MTYSVLVCDEATGVLGVGVQSRFFAVGSVVPWARAGVGAVATQSFPDVGYGPSGLAAMAEGQPAAQALTALLALDPNPEVRQVAMVDADGTFAVHTGSSCIPEAGSCQGVDWCAQGNLLASRDVLDAMAAALDGNTGDVARRIVDALVAAEAAGGDMRGSQAAALLVVSGRRSEQPWYEVLVDLRVDDSADPVGDLTRLLALHEAATDLGPAFAQPGFVFGDPLEQNDLAALLTAFDRAANRIASLQPDNADFLLWRTVVLARSGQLAAARETFSLALDHQPELCDLPNRLVRAGLITAAAAEQLRW